MEVRSEVAPNLSLQPVNPPRTSWYTGFVKNVTITLDEETARWIRIEAAEHDTSVSRFIGGLLRERMETERAYEHAMERYLSTRPQRLRAGGRLPRREELHDRTRLR